MNNGGAGGAALLHQRLLDNGAEVRAQARDVRRVTHTLQVKDAEVNRIRYVMAFPRCLIVTSSAGTWSQARASLVS